MKKLSFITTGLMLCTLCLGGTVTADSLSSTDTSDAVIEFRKVLIDEEIEIPGIDPEEEIDPGNPENPNPNPNPDGSLLRISYVSDFDFGAWGNTANGITAYSKAQPIYMANGSIQEVVPFVTTTDNRGTERGDGWVLTATASPLTDRTGHELAGAQIIMSNAHYLDTSVGMPTVSNGEWNLSSGPQTLVTTTATTGAGQWGLSLGVLQEVTTEVPTIEDASETVESTYTVTDGVRIEIPRNSITNNTEYQGSIVWELVSSI